MRSITKVLADRYGGKRATLRYLQHLAGYYAGNFRRLEAIDVDAVQRLVFVCKGNICRSAYANAVAVSCGLRAASFGLDTPGDEPADPSAIRNALVRGIDLNRHRTSSARAFVLERGDLLIVMEPEQAFALKQLDGAHQVTLLGLWTTPRSPFIQDPYGRSDAYFQSCFKLIESGVHGLQRTLKSTLAATASR